MLRVTSVTHRPGMTVEVASGRDEDGFLFLFAGDWESMNKIKDALDRGEDVWVEIDPSRIISRDVS